MFTFTFISFYSAPVGLFGFTWKEKVNAKNDASLLMDCRCGLTLTRPRMRRRTLSSGSSAPSFSVPFHTKTPEGHGFQEVLPDIIIPCHLTKEMSILFVSFALVLFTKGESVQNRVGRQTFCFLVQCHR